ncbi:hypothetical protein SDRG_01454 [Saprolegnia diclina VS20]|uniref:RING-type domain-containing protein n=1 Tax=Saprolegnia diclina (strain VS20) TaxID=1156394 RepID=T0SF38_SAPDV|nr:hypothetical protein SDRG_01454 [Saprolegnia diclina VS20]EQC41487.1 hypothetical protein SDRG_01454 [Saprolegnia diclina VS20]|eukprot:XP_008605201.1 hypothetical protein SDRG_01454 [Saprolegnia diclina VS20]
MTTSASEVWSLLAAPSFSPTYPPPRDSSTLQVLGDTAIIYGGTSAQRIFNDTWLFDLVAESWTQVPAHQTNPGARFDHVSVAHASAQELVVFGGTLYAPGTSADGYVQMNDVWVFSLQHRVWTPVVYSSQAALPKTRSEATAVVTGDGSAMVVSGGVTVPDNASLYSYPIDFNDVWAMDLTTHTWTELTTSAASPQPAARFSHAASTITVDGVEHLVIFSGRHILVNGWTILSDAWMLPLNSTEPRVWTLLTSSHSLERMFTSAVTVHGNIWFFGGLDYVSDSSMAVFADTIVGDVDHATRAVTFYADAPTAASPSERYGHRMAVWRDNVLLFGGQDRTYLGDLWLRNTSVLPKSLFHPVLPSADYALWDLSTLFLAMLSGFVAVCLGFGYMLYRKLHRHSRGGEPGAPVRPRGLSTDEIAQFELVPFEPTVHGSADDVCPICLVDFAVGERLRQLSCGHLFHPQCIDEWLHKNFTCPMCKRDLAQPTDTPPTADAP